MLATNSFFLYESRKSFQNRATQDYVQNIMTKHIVPHNISQLMLEATLAASIAIKAISSQLEVTQKSDGSALTNADLAAQQCLENILSQNSQIPLYSEEKLNLNAPPQEGLWFLADPLDGTKGFIKGHSDYTVNLSLMHGEQPIAGIIAAPALEVIYATFGLGFLKAKMHKNISAFEPAKLNHKPQPSENILLISHSEQKEKVFSMLNREFKNVIGMSSALKFIKVAEGSAQVYARTHPCMLWDIAAGIALVEAAGGSYKNFGRNNSDPWYAPQFAVFSHNDQPL